MTKTPILIKIMYCTGCNWLLRSAWIAQEILSTFQNEVTEVSLMPSEGGTYKILLNDEQIWCRKEQNGFPDSKTIKKIIRDKAFPQKDLGHIDSKSQ